MRAVPVSDGIHWVGAIDWNLRDFHGYETPNGTTYNAYLVHRRTTRSRSSTRSRRRSCPSCSSASPTSSRSTRSTTSWSTTSSPTTTAGCARSWRRCRRPRSSRAPAACAGIAGYHGADRRQVTAVGADDVIDLGGKTLQFLPMPMVHWPDSMFTYCAESGTLMPNDAFGQHLATSERFADEVDLDLADRGAHRSTTPTSCMPLATQVAKAVAKVIEQGWACDVIAPSHGVIWRHDEVPAAFDAYDRYTAGETEDKLVIAYSTMWGSTDILAREIADGAAAEGVDVALFDLASTPLGAHHAPPDRRARAASRQPDAASRDALPDRGSTAVHRGAQAQGQARRASSAATAGRAAPPSR